VGIQIKVLNHPLSAGVPGLHEVKNWNIEDFKMWIKISRTFNLKFKIYTTPPKYSSRHRSYTVVSRGEKLGT
jgi:hypothetical protein